MIDKLSAVSGPNINNTQKIGERNPFAGGSIGGKQGGISFGTNSSAHLDQTMLAQKSENFKNGIGGSPYPPEGKGQNLWEIC